MSEFQIIMLDEKKPNQIKVHNIWFHLCKSLDNTDKPVVADNILEVGWEENWDGQDRAITKGHKETLGSDDMFIISSVVMAFTGVRICQNWLNRNFKCIGFVTYLLYLNKAVKGYVYIFILLGINWN